jgi:hypothetical protein
MRTLSTISADFAKVEEIANRTEKGSLIRAKCGMRASSSDSSEPLLLVHRSARERCCLMTSRRDVIPHAHNTGIWGTSITLRLLLAPPVDYRASVLVLS